MRRLRPRKRKRTEANEQEKLVAWLRGRGLNVFHVPNQLVRGRERGAIYRRLGVQAGVADLIITDRVPNRPEVRGIAIEMKGPEGRLSKAQAQWLFTVKAHGWLAVVARTAKAAQEFIEGLGL